MANDDVRDFYFNTLIPNKPRKVENQYTRHFADLSQRVLGRAEDAYRALPGQVGANFEQPRQDVLDAFGAQFQDTADRQRALSAQLDQRFGRSGLGSLRGSQLAGLEQQAQRQNLATRSQQSGQLANVGMARAAAVSQAQSMLPTFLANRLQADMAPLQMRYDYYMARKNQKAGENNALWGALGSLGGAAIGAFGGPFGSFLGSQLGGGLGGQPMGSGAINPYTGNYDAPIGPTP